jgi:hypothetical protein
MSVNCKYSPCCYNDAGECRYGYERCKWRAHKPKPNESTSSPRTSGSPTASRSDSPVEVTAVQLAPVLRPEVVAASEGGDCQCIYCSEWRRLMKKSK